MIRILSHLSFFELKNVSHFGKKTRDPNFEEKIKEKLMVRTLSHLDFKCISSHVSLNSFDDFLSHLTIPPRSACGTTSFKKNRNAAEYYFISINPLVDIYFNACFISRYGRLERKWCCFGTSKNISNWFRSVESYWVVDWDSQYTWKKWNSSFPLHWSWFIWISATKEFDIWKRIIKCWQIADKFHFLI